jgi:hypothetical protein
MPSFTLATAAAGMGLSYLFLVGFGLASRPIAASSVLLSALVPLFILLSTLPMSEALFGLLVVVALWRVQASLTALEPESRWRQIGTGVLVALPLLCRGFGTAVIAGVLMVLARRRRPFAWVAVGSALLVLPWAWWTWLGVGASAAAATSFYTDYTASVAAAFSSHAPRIVGLNAVFILTGTLGLAFDGVRLLSGPASGAVVMLFLLLGGWSWWRLSRAAWHGHLVATCLVAYCAIAVVWPWPPARFLLPVLPLLVACSITMIATVIPRALVGRVVIRIVAGIVVAIAVLGHAQALVNVSAANRVTGFPDPLPAGMSAPAAGVPATWSSYDELFSWVRSHTESADVVACGLDTVIYLYTGRKSFRPAVYRPEARYDGGVSPVGSSDELKRLLESGDARYLALVPGYTDGSALSRAVTEIQRRSPGFLSVVYTGRDARFVVFRVGAGDQRSSENDERD